MASLALPIAMLAAAALPAAPPSPENLPPSFRAHQTKYYTVYSDLDDDTIREADMRISAVAEEYHARTKHFSGRIRERLPFYLFSSSDDYLAAGGLPKSAGVYRGDALMAVVPADKPYAMWKTVQHEGFHQFVHRVIGGDIPVWVNEGMAEYFEEGLYTGARFHTGLAPKWKIQLLKKMIRENRYRPFDDMLTVARQTWNHEMSSENYVQAWSMVYFLAHGGGPQVRGAFDRFLVEVGKHGKPWQRAWVDSRLGPGTAQFENMWRDYWLTLDESVSDEAYAEAAVEALTLVAARAHAAGTNLADVEELKTRINEGTANFTGDPPYPLGMSRQFTAWMDELGDWRLEPTKRSSPIVICARPDGWEFRGVPQGGPAGKTVKVIKRRRASQGK